MNGCAVEGEKSEQVAANEQNRKRLLTAGWQPTLRSAYLSGNAHLGAAVGILRN